jgi:hypothetical protein
MVWELSDMASIAHCKTMSHEYASEYGPTHGSRKKEEEYIKPLEMSEVMCDRKMASTDKNRKALLATLPRVSKIPSPGCAFHL